MMKHKISIPSLEEHQYYQENDKMLYDFYALGAYRAGKLEYT